MGGCGKSDRGGRKQVHPAPELLATRLPLGSVLVCVSTSSLEGRQWLFFLSLLHVCLQPCSVSSKLLVSPAAYLSPFACSQYLRLKSYLKLNFWLLSTSQLFSRPPPQYVFALISDFYILVNGLLFYLVA